MSAWHYRLARGGISHRYADAGCGSLDEFVEAQQNRRFLPLAKAAIICSIVQRETDVGLYPDSFRRVGVDPKGTHKKVDWLQYLFRQLKDEGNSDPNRFRLNKVRVITFNFDRSFERQLFRMLKASYGLSEAEATDLRRCIEVLHIHGRIGSEKWCDPREQKPSRSYINHAKAEDLQSLFNEIRIVHEDVQQPVVNQARAWLAAAKTICFLGFGFNKTNLNRLGVLEINSGTRIVGTALGLSEPEVKRVERRFGRQRPHIQLHDMSSYDLLRQTDVLQVD